MLNHVWKKQKGLNYISVTFEPLNNQLSLIDLPLYENSAIY